MNLNLLMIALYLLISPVSGQDTTIDDSMPEERPELFYPHAGDHDLPILPTGVELQYSEEINQQRGNDSLLNLSLGQSPPLPYAQDLMNCREYGQANGGRCGNCAKGVRHALMCLHNKMIQPESTELIMCGRGAYAYAQNDCMERMGFVRVTGEEQCSRPGTIRVYEGHKTNNFANCNRYQNGNYCGHIEFVGTDFRYYDTVCDPQDKPRNENAAPGTRNLVACFHLNEWTDPSTWYR